MTSSTHARSEAAPARPATQPAGKADATDAPPGLPGSTRGAWRLAVALLALLAACAVFGRIMAFPLRHDEQFYVPAGILFTPSGLYRGFGFNHLPNLPILLSSLFRATGTDHYLLAGRLLIGLAWAAGAAVLALMARLRSGSALVGTLAIALFVTNPVFLGATGMTVTNNFVPVVLTAIGLAFLLLGFGAAAPRRRAGWMVLSGLAVAIAAGFKANYIFIVPPFAWGLLAAPIGLPFAARLRQVVLPFLAGAIVGAGPTLAYFIADPADLWAHVVRYHRVAQIRYWAGDEDAVAGLGQKLALAHQLWIGGAGGLIPLTVAVLLCLMAIRRGARATLAALNDPAVIMVTGLIVLGCLVSFVPTPSFPQYYAPPIIFGIVLVILLHGLLRDGERREAAPAVAAILAFAIVAGTPQLATGLGGLVRPSHWTGIEVHREAGSLARERGGRQGPVATLAPLYPLEAGLPIYPELASGPFIYRVADTLRVSDADHYRHLTSPGRVTGVLDRTPPSAMLLGLEGDLEAPLIAFGRAHGFEAAPPIISDRRGRPVTLLLAPR